jgi:hypothetical protein
MAKEKSFLEAFIVSNRNSCIGRKHKLQWKSAFDTYTEFLFYARPLARHWGGYLWTEQTWCLLWWHLYLDEIACSHRHWADIIMKKAHVKVGWEDTFLWYFLMSEYGFCFTFLIYEVWIIIISPSKECSENEMIFQVHRIV